MRLYGFQNEVKSYLNRLERENGFRISSAVAKQLNDRVESLKKSGIWAQYGLGFNDVDGDAYLTRASVTDLIGRAEVLWFVRGMKALGLYSNMVAWPMRSYQNRGTGSTVYSLGGLGTYNGTSYNSPTWGTSGIVNSNTSRIDSATMPYYDNHTVLFTTRIDGDFNTINMRYSNYGESSAGRRYGSQPAISLHSSLFFFDKTSNWIYRAGFAADSSIFQMGGYSITNGALLEASDNAGNYISTAPPAMNTGGNSVLSMGNYPGGISFGIVGVLSSYIFISKPTSASVRSSMYTLQKNTISSSLGLP